MGLPTPDPLPTWRQWAVITIRAEDGSVSNEVFGGHGQPAIDDVDRVARLVRAARRACGCVQLHQVHEGLAELLNLCGLGGLLDGPG